jgi:AcrR family transcriptional regulator
VPRPRFAKLDPAKKEAIFSAALEAFASNGFAGASYNQIIENAGISKGAMYYYFDDKEDLYATLVRYELEEILQHFDGLPEVGSPTEFWEMLVDLIRQTQAFVVSEPLKIKLLRSLMKMRFGGQRSPLLQDLYELGEQFSAQLIKQGQAIGAVRTDLPFELLVGLVTAVDEAGDCWMLENLDMSSVEEMGKFGLIFTDLLRRMLEPGDIKIEKMD